MNFQVFDDLSSHIFLFQLVLPTFLQILHNLIYLVYNFDIHKPYFIYDHSFWKDVTIWGFLLKIYYSFLVLVCKSFKSTIFFVKLSWLPFLLSNLFFTTIFTRAQDFYLSLVLNTLSFVMS